MATETEPPLPDRPLVFVSYSHKDERWKERLRAHLGVLEQEDQIVIWDDRQIEPSAEWYDKIKEIMAKAAVAVCLISADYLSSRFCTKEEIPHLLERRKSEGMQLFLVYLRPCAYKAVRWLEPRQMLPTADKPISRHYRGNWDTPFADISERIFNILSDPNYQPPKPPAPKWLPLAEELVDISGLPVTGAELFGRQRELQLLDEAWEADKTNVVSLVAWGGVGKSTLVNKWLEALRADNWRGARRVLGWSFYSQGTGERASSADQFIDHALRFFGDPDPTEGSPWSKGERLAELVRKEKALLVLDGLEPLQDHYQGIKDPALQRLIEELARENTGLCVITTREPVTELADFRDSTIARNLEQISPEAGRALLRVQGVRGTDTELEQASEAFGNHALAINLLANFLRAIPGHPIAKAWEIPDLDIPPEQGRHHRRVMAAFAERFGKNSAEVELLRLLGLFDRPATTGAVGALRKPPPIHRLTNHLSRLDEAGWLRLLESLRDVGLVAPKAHQTQDDLDAHPLVREHFGAELREKHQNAWRAGHRRLYEYFKALPKKYQPDTLEELAPLFQAVFHGCQAGRHQTVLNEVYRERIVRHNQAYVARKLGAFGTDLAAMAGFFDLPWEKPLASIIPAAQAFVLNQAGFDLGALGRLREAIPPTQASLALCITLKDWRQAAIRAVNLSQLQLRLGEVAEAIALAEQSVACAERKGDVDWRIVSRAVLADALHQAAERARAEALFREAERLQVEDEPRYPRLYSLRGYQYCDLLLDFGRHAEIRERAVQTLDWMLDVYPLLDIALDHLSLGRAEVLAYEADRSGDLAKAERQLNQAVDGLLKAGQISDLPHGLLARAAYFRVAGPYDRARRDLDEVMRIATRSGMRLFECDAHLELARLALAEGKPDAARDHVARAAALVQETGYHRRDGEVQKLRDQLGEPG
jgi:tetratricopeptide (TPR) repeat protein